MKGKLLSLAKFIKDKNAGMGLLELLVVSSILLGLSVYTISIYQNGLKVSKDLDSRQEIRDLRDQIYLAVKSNDCGLLPPTGSTDPIPQLDPSTATTVTLSKLYTSNSSFFAANSTIGNFTIDGDIVISSAPDTSPITAGCTEKVGNFCKINGAYASEVIVKLKKTNGKSVPLRLMALVQIDEVNKNIIGCRSMTDLGNSKQSCESIQDTSSVMAFWDEESLKCKITIVDTATNGGTGSDGLYVMTEVGTTSDTYIIP